MQKETGEAQESRNIFADPSAAAVYDTSAKALAGNEYARTIRELLDLVPLSPTDVVMDLGGGTGLSTAVIKERNPRETVIVDPAAAMLEQARAKYRENPHVHVVQASAEALPFPDKSIDKVVSANVFMYFPDPETALREVARVLQPDGAYLFNTKLDTKEETTCHKALVEPLETAINQVLETDMKLPSPYDTQRRYSRNGLEQLTAASGLVIEQFRVRPNTLTREQITRYYDEAFRKMRESAGEQNMRIERIIEITQGIIEKEPAKDIYNTGEDALVVLRKAG